MNLWKSFLLLEKRYIFSRLENESSSKHKSTVLSSTTISTGYRVSDSPGSTANGVSGPECASAVDVKISLKEPGSNVGRMRSWEEAGSSGW